VDELIESFHANHQRIFSVDDRASPIEFLNWTGRLSIRLPQATMTPSKDADPGQAERETRTVLFDVDDRRATTIVRGDTVRVGETITGPAIIEEATTTLVLPPGTAAVLSAADSYVVEFDP
jgi:N-methylhydantoinase A